jgi:DNA invertase Pin-like site-specific DNA recombinase
VANEYLGWVTTESLFYQDEGVSGATAVEDRSAFSRLKQDIISGRVDIVLVWKLDRAFRNVRLLLDWTSFLTEYGVTLISKNDNIDLSNAVGRMQLSLL